MRLLFPLLGLLAMLSPTPAIDPAALTPDKLTSRPELPDLMTMFDGTKVTTKAEWEAKRKPELKELFQTVMYGKYPAVKPDVRGTVLHEDKAAFGGKGTLREVAVKVTPGATPVHLLVVTPNGVTGKVPVFLGLMFGGNHNVTDDPKVRVPDGWMYPSQPGAVKDKATDVGRGKSKAAWPIEAILGKGYAVAVFYAGEVIPDNAKLRGGLADIVTPLAKGETDPAATGTVMAWAWGTHRMIDYLVTLPEIDAKKIAVVGHSRLGKATIVAAAFDDRVALAIPHQAGCGGTAPDRRTNAKSEPLARINAAFPHWFSGNFKAFSEVAEKLPFDQHALVALCAPRPLLFSNATGDQWADPAGQFEVLRAANPAYALYGEVGMDATAFPAENTPVGQRLGYWVRPGTHQMNRADWDAFLAFADKQFGR